MQQKSTQKILLFSVAAQKVEKIKSCAKLLEYRCNRWKNQITDRSSVR